MPLSRIAVGSCAALFALLLVAAFLHGGGGESFHILGTQVTPTVEMAGLPAPMAQPAPTPIVFPTPLPTATPIALPTPVRFPTPLPTPTPVALPTPLPTATPIAVPTPLPTATPVTFPTPLPTPTPVVLPPDGEVDVSALYRDVAGSVLYIETPDDTGTGWAMGEGIIVTNEHVVSGEEAVTVRHAFLPPFRADVVFTDAVIDVAFLTYDTEARELEPLPRRVVSGDNHGETVLALGYSSVGVQEDGAVGGAAIKRGVLSQIVDFGEQGGRQLRIDAVVDPGDSGGPVVDTLGRVVGMSKGVVETDETGRRVVGIFYAVHMEEIETLLARYEAEATPP